MERINTIMLYELSQNKSELIKRLECWGLIPKEGEYMCKKCGGKLKLMKDTNRTDGYRWKCMNKISKRKQKRSYCYNKVDLRTGTFFERSHLSIFQILGFINFWVENANLALIENEIEISHKTALAWASYCREVVLNGLIDNSEKLGGEGIIVEIKESKFDKRKYHRGHLVEGQSIFGGYERDSGRVFMVPVEGTETDTLIPIIKHWIKPGTTIVSDYWKVSNCTNTNTYKDLKLNHSVTFNDSETRPRNSIEFIWQIAKATMCAGGRKKSSIPGNLARYLFYKRSIKRSLNRKVEFFKLAGELYNPTKNDIPPPDGEITDEEDTF